MDNMISNHLKMSRGVNES